MGGFIQRLRQWWDTADRNQKVLTVGGSAFLLLMLAGIFYFASRPKMSLLFGGLTPADQGGVVTELEKDSIPYDIDAQGSVFVPSNMVADARMKLAQADKMPKTVGFGDKAFAGIGMMNTPDVEKARLNAILEDQLDRSIESLAGIQTASVHIVLGSTSNIEDQNVSSSASITVSPRGDALISKSQAKAIALLVASAVPNLRPAGVTVVDSSMNILFDGKGDDSTDGQVSNNLATEQAEEKRVERELQGMLDQVYGPNSSIVKVNLQMNFDDKHWTQTTQTPSDKLPISKIQETMQGSGAVPGGAAGMASNSTVGAPAGVTTSTTSNGSTYTMTQAQNDFLKNSKTMEVQAASGEVTSMAIDVIGNSNKIKNQKDIQQIVNGYLGSLTQNPAFTSQVTLTQFDTSQAKAAAKAADGAASQQRMQQILSILPIAALIGIGFFVLKQISKFSKFAPVPALQGAGGLGGRLSGGSLAASLGGGGFDGDDDGFDSPTLGRGEDGTAVGKPRPKRGPQEEDDDDDEESIRVKSIGTKVNVPLEQLKKMGDKKPEAVAMLIKGWMAEEGR